MKNVIFLSYFLNEETPVYGGEKNMFLINKTKQIVKGDNSNNLQLSFPNHIGTHIDFPSHFNNEGKTCSEYPASFWIFDKIGFLECSIQDFPSKISRLSSDIEILILKTGFGEIRNEKKYWAEQPVIPSYFATLLKSNFPSLRLFGFDMISLTSKLNREEGKFAHINFLINEDILILEDMDLSLLRSSPSLIIVSPLQVEKSDGVPCNVIAVV
jgi:arylformamidase